MVSELNKEEVKTKNTDKDKPRFSNWREWAVLSNIDKTKLYPSLTPKEKSIIWCEEYMKIIPLNIKYVGDADE